MVRVAPIGRDSKSIEWSSEDAVKSRDWKRSKLMYKGVVDPTQMIAPELWTLRMEAEENGYLHGDMEMQIHMFGIAFSFQTEKMYAHTIEESTMSVYFVNEATDEMSKNVKCDLVLISGMNEVERARMNLREEMNKLTKSDTYVKIGLPTLAFGGIIRDIIDYADVDASEIMTTDMYIWVDAVWRADIGLATYKSGGKEIITDKIMDLVACGRGSSVACTARISFEVTNAGMSKRRLRVILGTVDTSFIVRGCMYPRSILKE
jgi:hypothetical protein